MHQRKLTDEQKQDILRAELAQNPEADVFDAEKIKEFAAKDADGLVKRKGKTTAADFDQGGQRLELARNSFNEIIAQFQEDVANLERCSKTAHGKIRQQIDKTAAAFQKINNSHPLEKVERQAKALSEMADALERIAALKESGKLDKIIAAVN